MCCCEAPGQERVRLTVAPTLTPRKRGKEDTSPALCLGLAARTSVPIMNVTWTAPEAPTTPQVVAGTELGLPQTMEHHATPQQQAWADREEKLPPLLALHIHKGKGQSKEGSSCLSQSGVTYAHSAEERNLPGCHRTALKLDLHVLYSNVPKS